MSPELLFPEGYDLEDSQPTKESDNYAFGMVVFEVLSGQPPFAGYKGFIVTRKVIEGERPERPEGSWFTNDLWGTLKQCWSPQPEERPTAAAVLKFLVCFTIVSSLILTSNICSK
jgi:serine/threonine protein kinase